MARTNVWPRHARMLVVFMAVLILSSLTFAAPPQSTHCKGITFLWSHVYNPQRLQKLEQCVTVSGVIDSTRREADGDLHIRLKLDSQFASLLNSGNKSNQGGDLVVEPICDHTVTQPDAVTVCSTFHSTIPHYPAGTRVLVTGSHVLDHEHGWMEIHPVTRITATQ